MAKRPINRQQIKAARQQHTYTSKPKSFPWLKVGIPALVVLGVGWLAWSQLQGRQTAGGFDTLIAQGKPNLTKVAERPNAGQGHSEVGKALGFNDDPPTSGIHWPVWTNAGFYTAAEPKEKLVHALEHGNVVIYYDQPGEEALRTLRAWAGQFSGQWDGLVVVPKAGLGQGLELTAWTKVMWLEAWDAASAAAFADAYRGRGPENPVR